jgi:3-hydroxyisobutyrate dehydrogenase-like beta-hydroxyacid dehydrogenase
MRAAVIGLGSMGRAFAARGLESGHQVTVWNRTPGRAGELVAKGATEARTVSEAVTGADVVLLVLADDAAVLDVCEGEGGVFESLGSDAVLANLSTVSPDTVRHLANVGPDDRVLDTPVMGAPDHVAHGHGRFFLGGPLATITGLEPLWDDLSDGYVHCGPVGAAATLKVISNLLLITGVTALAEGIATARAHGIGDELLKQVFSDSPVVSLTSAIRLDTVMDVAHPGWFSPTLARKDVRLAIGLAEQRGIPVGIGPATEALLTSAIEARPDTEWPDFSAVIEALSP